MLSCVRSKIKTNLFKSSVLNTTSSIQKNFANVLRVTLSVLLSDLAIGIEREGATLG